MISLEILIDYMHIYHVKYYTIYYKKLNSMSSITGKDALPLKNKYKFTDREINWLWHSQFYAKKHPLIMQSNILEKRNIIETNINNQRDEKNHLNNYRVKIEQNLIKESEIEWINKKDEILLTLIINLLKQGYNLDLKTGLYPTHYSYFLSIIDELPNTAEEKLSTINNIKNYYFIISQSPNDTNWIDINNKEQIDWAWNYLKKNNLLAFLPIFLFNTPEYYNAVISSIYLLSSNINIPLKELVLLKMKKAWSQQKFRLSGKVKKAYHLPLTKEANKKLKKLSEVMNKTESQILEILIEEKYQVSILDENGKSKY